MTTTFCYHKWAYPSGKPNETTFCLRCTVMLFTHIEQTSVKLGIPIDVPLSKMLDERIAPGA